MKQYLLAVHSVDGDPVPSQEDMEPVYEAVNKFNAELQTSGAWVFAGGLYPPTSATVVRAHSRGRSSPPMVPSPRQKSSSGGSGS